MATPHADGPVAEPGAWRLSVLGPVEIYFHDQRVEVQGVARALLALLTRSAGQVVSVEAIVDGLWGARPPAGAERAVASYVSRLRKALARAEPHPNGHGNGNGRPSIVVTRPPGYLLAVDPTDVDLTVFEARVAEGRRALGIGQPALAAARLRDGLALWRGDAYADVVDVAFAPAETRRLAELRLAAVESRVEADLDAAAPVAPPTLASELQLLIAENPHRERLWAQLITTLHRQGQQADALATYQRARSRLIEDLGVEPGQELRAAERAVLGGGPVLAGRPTPVAVSALPAGLPGPVPGCVGRDGELAVLEAALDEAATANGQTRLIVGGPGSGKTRLAAEVAHRAARRGVAIQYGSASSILDALVADPERLTLVILDDVDQASESDRARVAAWVRAGRNRSVLTLLTAADEAQLGELDGLPRIELTGLAGRPSTVEREPEPVRDVVACPYKGLAAFEASDAELFHGRERLVAEVVARLLQGRLLAVVGASGSGKSSLVRAGLLPALAAGVLPGSERWRQVLVTPAGTRDLAARLGPTDSPGADPSSPLVPRGSNYSAAEPTVLFVDQFEEVFTALDATRRDAFLNAVVAAVERRVTVVLALRSDFFGRCADHDELASLVGANTVLIRPMAADELRRAVERPAAQAGLMLEDGLVDRLVDDVRGASGGLPLLSTSLLSLWERRTGRTLTLAAYREAGGVAGAVEQLGERAYASLATPQLRDCARRMLLRLAETGGEHAVVRRRASRDELEAVGGPMAPSVLDLLAERRLITMADDVVEVAHEALLTEWKRLRTWLAEDSAGRELRAHLTPAATVWARAGDAGELYRGARLAAAQDWGHEHDGELTDVERDFIRASSEAVAADALSARRTVRRLRQTLVAAAAALLVAIAGTALAVVQQHRADAAAAEADARRLAAQALVERDLGRAMLYGVAATRLYDSPETRGNLMAALNRAPGLLHTASLTDGDRYQALAVAPTGTSIAVGSVRGVIQLYDTASLRLLHTLRYPQTHTISDLAFAADGHRLLAFGDLARSGTPGIVEWDLDSGAPVGAPFGPMMPTAGRMLADGDSIAVAAESSVQVWSLSRRVPVRTLPGLASTMTVGADQRTVVLGGPQETVVVDGLTGHVTRRWPVPMGRTLSPDGQSLLLADGTDVAVWDATGKRGVARQHTGPVQAIAWAADGRTFATTSDDRTTIVWDAGSLRPVEEYAGPPGRQVQVGYSVDGRSLFTAGQDGSVYLWDLTGSRREETQLDPAGPYVTGKIDPENASATFDAERGRAVVTEGDRAYLVDVATGKPIGDPIPIGAESHQWPDLDANGNRLAIGLADGRGRVWDVASRDLLLDVSIAAPDDKTVWSYVNAGLSGDGHTVAFARYLLPPVNRTEIAFYDIDSGRRLPTTWRIEGAAANRFGASPDGRYLVATTAAGFAAVWDLRQSKEVARLAQPANGSAMLAKFSRDGRYVVVGNGIGRPTLWRVSDWSLVWQAEDGHNGYDVSVSFSPDGSLLASSGSDSKIFLYDMRTGEMLGEAFGPDRSNWLYAEFRADRNEIVGYFDDGSMARWDVDPASQIRTACQIAGRQLTRAEWDKLLPRRPYQNICP